MPKVTPFLWYDDQAEAAANHYVKIFPNSKIKRIARYGEAGPGENGSVMVVEFELDGQPFCALNGGPHFKFDEAVSFVIDCEDQKELDYYWDALIAGGGKESMCGWLKDKFGLSWQVNATRLTQLMLDPDPARTKRATEAMLKMKKIDIAAAERAAAG